MGDLLKERATRAQLVKRAGRAEVYRADWRDLAALVERRGGCDALITDTPFSARTHSGHDVVKGRWRDGAGRRALDYGFWTPDQVVAFVDAWAPLVRGWFVTITDHVLAPVWSQVLEDWERYVFPPIPAVLIGSRVRRAGDGPSCWTYWIVVARPRRRPFSTWGTLPGGYCRAAQAGRLPVVGGKPLWLMEDLVRDYTADGDLVVDPCCGAGTTAVAALRHGRRALVGDVAERACTLSAVWISDPAAPAPRSALRREG